MEYYKHLYIGDSVRRRTAKIIRRLDKGMFPPNVYVITLSDREGEELEFYNSAFLFQRAFREKELLIVGLAGSYEESLELVQEITEEVLRKTEGTDIKAFLMERQYV